MTNMIKTITEFIPQRKNYIGVNIPEHTVSYSYDTDNIKSRCTLCFDKITGNLEKNYLNRGNYCWYCSTGLPHEGEFE